jgi:hypothetical protein
MILLDITTKIYASDSRTSKMWKFFVPNGLSSLTMKCAYSPKYVEDEERAISEIIKTLKIEAPYATPDDKTARRFLPLVNMLSYTLDSPSGWVGTSHAHSPDQMHEIKKEGSSFGFADVEIEDGEWTFCLSVDGVVDDYVTARFTVEGKK